jgi:hypothetical protein
LPDGRLRHFVMPVLAPQSARDFDADRLARIEARLDKLLARGEGDCR